MPEDAIHRWNPQNGPQPEERNYDPPTPRQIRYAELLAAQAHSVPPAHAYRSKGLCGLYIQAMRG